MTTITLPRAAVEQALDVLNLVSDEGESKFPATIQGVISDLEAALAQQAEPVEPVAWSGYDLDGMVEAFSRVIEAHHSSEHPFHNPIDMDAQMALRILRGFIPAMKAHAAPPQRKPLTEEEVFSIFRTSGSPVAFARAIEHAHGIKE